MAEVARWRRCIPWGDTRWWWREQAIVMVVMEAVELGYCEQMQWKRMANSSSGSSRSLRKEVISSTSCKAPQNILEILAQILVHSAGVVRMVEREVEVEARARLELRSRSVATFTTSSEGSTSSQAASLVKMVVAGLGEVMVPPGHLSVEHLA